MKRLLQLSIIMIILSFPIIGFAAPDEMAVDDKGTAKDLITISTPEKNNVTTYNEKELISGSGKEGVTITFYVYDSQKDKYKKVIVTRDNIEKALESELGASGLFAHELQLREGMNRFALRAELDKDNYQVEKVEFIFEKGFVNTIKELSIGFKDIKTMFKNLIK